MIEVDAKAMEAILTDEFLFNQVVTTVFKAIDTDCSGTIEKVEITDFILEVCDELNIKDKPEQDVIDEVFKELDKTQSNHIDEAELANFMRDLFSDQLKTLKNTNK